MSEKKRILKNSVIYTFSNLLLKAFSFFLLPLYTSYLSTKDYGIIGLVGSFTSVAGYIIAFSLFSAVVKFYTEFRDDPIKVKRLFGTLFLFVLLSGCIFSAIFFLLRNLLMGVFFEGINYFPTIFIAFLGLTFNSVYLIYMAILQTLQQARKSAIISIVFFCINLVLNLLFVVVLKLGANGVLLSSTIVYVAFVLYAVCDLHSAGLMKFCIDKSILLPALKYSIPLLPHNLSTTIAQLVSRIFINSSYTLVSVGLFNLGSQFGSLADIIQSSVNSAFTPWLYSRLKESSREKDEQLVSMTNCLMIFYGICFLGLAFFSQEAILVLTSESYHKGWTVVPIIVVSYTIKTTYYFYIGVMFYYTDLSKKIFWATCSAALINIVLSAIFIPHWDMYGSALADVLAMLLRTVIIVILARKRVSFGYRVRTFILFSICTIVFIGIGITPSYLYFPYEVSIVNIIFKIGMLLIYTTVICLYFRKDVSPMIQRIIRYMKERRTN